MTQIQTQKAFFDATPDRMYPHLPPRPTDAEIRMQLAENSQTCPLNEVIVGKSNEGNMRTLRRFAFTAFQRPNRSCRGCNFGIFSPPGQGKTFVAKRFAKTIGIPFIFIQSPSLDNTYVLFEQIKEEFEKCGTPLVQQTGKSYDFYLPPCIVFFDEAHELPNSMTKGSLLNAMEPDDAMMVVKFPGSKGESFRVDCWEVCWIAATTERGSLFDAFEQRLTTAIEWHPAAGEELVTIIKSGLDSKVKTGELKLSPSVEVCKMIANYQSVPRLAIHGFGTKVVQHKAFMPSCTWEECCKIVAHDIGLNEWGFTKKQMDILKACGQRPIAQSRLPDITRCRQAQVNKYELPPLMQYTGGGPYLVSVSGRGLCVTKAGLRKLEEMGIPHKGDRITAEHFEAKR